MQITKAFVFTMKNFARINQNMYFKEGTVQTTALFPATSSNSLTLFARAKTDVQIEQPFAILDLNKFLATISIFPDFSEVETTFDKTHIHFRDKKKSIDYQLTDPTYVKYEINPDRIQLGETNIKFQITDKELKSLLEIYSLFGLEHVAFIGKNGVVTVEASNEDFGSRGSIIIGETSENFKAVIKTQNLLIKDSMSYNISIVRRGYVHFQNEIFEYFIPAERDLSQL